MKTELKAVLKRPKISEKFDELREKKEGALIGYVMAGDPTFEASSEVVKALAKGERI